MVISISRKRATLTEDVVARTVASSLGGMARSLDIGDNLGLVSIAILCCFRFVFFSLENVL